MASTVPPAAPETPSSPPPASATGTGVADPAPLGLGAFATTTFVLSCFNANLINAGLAGVVLPLALAFGGLAQLLAGMWEFRNRNTFGATAFTSYGAFWLSYALLARYVAPTLPLATAHQATGLYLLVWAIFTVYMTVAALRVNGAVLGVFVALSMTFILLAAGEFAQSADVAKAGGWVGLITAVIAWYASFAVVTNATWKRSVVPTWPLS
ncbi:acetate uptake transporter [Streptomyces sp. PTM05]|uniref:Acetate uptake transporter n=1 Tax=Streptantibioticus parmotrematis TaxID=2873249 RepID=A0ABS7QYN1_9ACTN|nr:acetate uptake transporter [Streptantibioticus parmotrematis]MBY8888322.1 acetate uptake transporter [Streptantibioticus parmotrematis]